MSVLTMRLVFFFNLIFLMYCVCVCVCVCVREREREREREGGRGRQRERNTDWLFYLLMHLLVVSCMSHDWRSNLQPWCIRFTRASLVFFNVLN